MIKLYKYIIKLWLIPIWFMIFTLFADGANIDDFFMNSVSIHTDDSEIQPDDFGIADSFINNSIDQLNVNLKIQSIPHTKTLTSAHYIYDQDSPALDASTSNFTEILNFFQNEDEVFSTINLINIPLYILNCTFLI